MRTLRGYKTVLQEAELMSMPPVAVVDFLKQRGSQNRSEAWNDPVDADVERALRGRSEPSIDLALARYGRSVDVAADLFQSAEPAGPIRIACLANRSHGHFLTGFPLGLLGGDETAMVNWLETASGDELAALFENPTLPDSFLRDILERSNGWEGLSDDKLCDIVWVLTRNPRMRTAYPDDYMDGHAEYSYASVFNAAWKLAETAPTKERWAACLGWLYEQLEPPTFSINEPLTLAARWNVMAEDAEAMERQAKDHAIGYLSSEERVRKGLARLALSRSGQLLTELLGSEDVAFRAAAYAAGELTVDQLQSGYEKDGELVFNYAIHNLALWKHRATRRALGEIAWSVVRNDEHSDLLATNRFKLMEKEVRKEHPAWFSDEDESEHAGHNEVDDQVPATKADLSAIASHMERQSQGIDATGQALRSLMSRAGWIWWFSLGALVASLIRF